MKSGIESFGTHLCPEVVTEIESWDVHPELSKLLEKLRSVKDAQQFLDHYAEAMVARYFVSRGCELRVEVLTTAARTADLCVLKNGLVFYVHVKRLHLDELNEKEIRVQNRLWDLKKIRRPVILLAQLWKIPTDEDMQVIYRRLKEFVQTADIGETISMKGHSCDEIAQFTIVSEHKGQSVQVVPMGTIKHVDDQKRFYKKLSKAYKQFVCGAINVILVTSLWGNDIEDFEWALLGTTYEVRGMPPDSPVIESGRKDDGFWSQNKHPESFVVGWFNFEAREDHIDFTVWYRENYAVPPQIIGIFPSTQSQR